MTILAGDIGKEKSKLGLFFHKKDSSGSIIIDPDIEPIIQAFETEYEVSALQNMIAEFLKDNYDDSQEYIYGASFAIAAPIRDKGTAVLSHGDQTVTFREQDFRQKLPYPNVPVAFFNDMEAIGYGIFLGDGESKLLEIHTPQVQTNPNERRALMLVSGGLGASMWYCFDDKEGNLRPISSEWGHTDFAARTKEEKALKEHLENRKTEKGDHSPVSKEYLLSSRGLIRICEFLVNTGKYGNESPQVSPNLLIEKALQGNALCKDTLDLFMGIWGAESGNLALTFNATGGVCIVSDLPIPSAKFQEGAFLEAFFNKEPENMSFRETLQKTPVKLIQEQNIALWGAARYAIDAGFVTKGKFAIMRANQ
jgi:glucokinase